MDFLTNRLLRDVIPLFRALASVVLILGIAAILILGKDVIIHIALAVLLSFILAPIVRMLEKLGVGRGIAVTGAILFALVAIGSIFYVSYTQAAIFAAEIPSYEPLLRNKISGISAAMAKSGVFSNAVETFTRLFTDIQNIGANAKGPTASAVTNVRVDSGESGMATIVQYLGPVLQPVATLFIVLLLAAFILASREDLRNRVVRLAGTEEIQQTTAAIDDAGRRVGRMLLTQVILNTTFGLVISFGLWGIGIPSPFLWGIMAGVLRFVPYIGAVIGTALPVFVGFAVDPTWMSVIYTIALFGCIELIVGQILEPLLYGHSAGISPVAIIIAATVWSFLWGPIGLVLSTPLTICIVVMGRYVARLKFLDILLGDRPVLAPEEIFYQRMLANDPHEATVQARAYIKARDKTDYYDNIALEAVRRAHVDIIRGHLTGERIDNLVKSTNLVVETLANPVRASSSPSNWKKAPSPETSAALELIIRRSSIAAPRLHRQSLADKWALETPVAVLFGDNPLDQPVARMLQQSLEDLGLKSETRRLAAMDCATEEGATERAVVCLSFIEPLSLVHLRAVLHKVRVAAPQAHVILCLWQKTDATILENVKQKLHVKYLATTNAAAVDIVFRLASHKQG